MGHQTWRYDNAIHFFQTHEQFQISFSESLGITASGLAVALKVLENLANTAHPNIIYSGGNAQEEVGLRGAKTTTHMIRPDIAFALNTGTAGAAGNDASRSGSDGQRRNY